VQIFQTKVLRSAFLYLHIDFVFFWRKNIGEKGAHKMLMKLTQGVNITNILGTDSQAVDLHWIYNGTRHRHRA